MSSRAEQTSSGRIDEDEQTAEEETVGCCRLFTRDETTINQINTKILVKLLNTAITNIYIIFVLRQQFDYFAAEMKIKVKKKKEKEKHLLT